VVCVADGQQALAYVSNGGTRPDLVLSDFNLPGAMNGVATIEALREALAWKIPAIVLTGDIRSQAADLIAKHGIAIATKPVNADELLRLINRTTSGSLDHHAPQLSVR